MMLCLKTIGDTVSTAPASPVNMDGAIDSSQETLGPIFIDHPDTIGQGNLNANALGETSLVDFGAVPKSQIKFHLEVRTTILVTTASYGITDHLDASLILPAIQEAADVQVRIGPFEGHTTFSAAGIGDLNVRLKYQIHPNVALTLKAIFPTGDSSLGFGLGSYWLTPGITASVPIGNLAILNAQVAGELDLSNAKDSGLSYGVGAATRLGPVALVVEFLGSKGIQNSLSLFDVTYGDGHTFDLTFGLRAPLPYGFMVFAAGTYALDHDGIRPAGVSPVLGVGWTAMP